MNPQGSDGLERSKMGNVKPRLYLVATGPPARFQASMPPWT
jgi:hypothetical protein